MAVPPVVVVLEVTVALPPVENPDPLMVTFWPGTAVPGDMLMGLGAISRVKVAEPDEVFIVTVWVPVAVPDGTTNL